MKPIEVVEEQEQLLECVAFKNNPLHYSKCTNHAFSTCQFSVPVCVVIVGFFFGVFGVIVCVLCFFVSFFCVFLFLVIFFWLRC